MPRFVTKLSGLLSAASIAVAILVGFCIGLGLALAIIVKIWG